MKVTSRAVAVLIVLAGSLWAPPSVAAAQAPEGEIAFVSDRTGDTEIYVVGADGGRPRNLTDDPGQDAAPAWSPDGRQLAFASTRDGTWDLFVLSMDDGSLRQLTDDPGAEFDPAWPFAMGRIVFERTVRGRREIGAVAPEGGRAEAIVPSPRRRWDLDPQWWTNTGREIVFASDRRGGFDLWVTTVGTTPRRLTTGRSQDLHPTVSPDGRVVAFERARRDDHDLYLLDHQTDRLRRATAGRADDTEPTWAPDNRHLAFVSDRDGGLDIHVLDTVTRAVTNLTGPSAGLNTTPAWRPAGAPAGAATARAAQGPMSLSCPASGPLKPTPGGGPITGGAADDTICGGPGDDAIRGHGGDDRLAGDSGRDRLWGGPGDDMLFGGMSTAGTGPDRLYGGPGDDRLMAKGDRARDCLWGGAGDDVARLSPGSDAWADNRSPAPWGRRRCGDTNSLEAIE